MVNLLAITGKAISGEWGTDCDHQDGIPVLRTTNFRNNGTINYDNVVIRNIIKDVNEIDTSTDYDELKKKAYAIASENIEQQIEDKWINLDQSEIDIYISGGTSLNMSFDGIFKRVDDPQMATAKGLWLAGSRLF